MQQEELIYQLALFRLFRWNIRKERELLAHYGSPSQVWQSLSVAEKDEAWQHAEKEVAFIQEHNIQTYYYQDDNYPHRLKECVDAPILLFGKGLLQFNNGKMLSIVGTRMATERGKEQTRQLVMDLKERVPDITIISGLAYGIDVAAHRAALEVGLPTIIVPAHGLDRIYPSVHRNVAVQSLERGGLLTEYPSGTEPEKMNFVARNRIIAGLADAVVIVESKAKGGSLITANMALDYNREVFTFPGRTTDEMSQGCNQLIRDHRATLINTADDLVNAMQWENQRPQNIQTELVEMEDIDDTQKKLLNKLREAEEGIHINMLVMETQLPYADVVSSLMMMAMKGWVKDLPGGVYRALK